MTRVLIVDDSAPAIAKLKRTLASLGYATAGSAATAAQAMVKTKHLQPDIILMAMFTTGEIDYADAARLIQDDLDTPVIFLIDHDDRESVSRAKEARAYGYCVKPIRKGDLKAVIESALVRWESERGFKKPYRELVENTYDLIHVQDGRGIITFVNKTVIETLGYAYDEIVGKNIKAFVTPETYQSLTKLFERQLKGERIDTFEMQVYDKRGNIRIFETRQQLVRDGDRIVEIQGISRDITGRKRTEKQLVLLSRLRERLLGPYTLSEKLAFITDKIVEAFNADFARIWIVEPGDLCDTGCYHAGVIEGPHTCRDRDRCLHLVVSTGRYTHINGEMHRRVPLGCYKIGKVASGMESKFVINEVIHDPLVHDHTWAEELGLVSFAGYRLLSVEGEPIGVLALFSKHIISHEEDALLEDLANTTAQVIQESRTEEILRQSEERYRTLFDNATFGIFHSLPNGSLLRVNKPFARMLGYDSSEEMVASITDIARDVYVEPGNRAKIVAEITEKGRWGDFEERFRCRDGSVIFARLHIRPAYGSDSNLEYLEGFVEDISEKKQVEEERRKVQEAVRRDRELKEKILQTAAVGIAFAENRKITWGNMAIERIFGFTDSREYIGNETSLLYASDEEFERIGKLVYEGTRSGEIIETVAKFKRTDATEFLGLIRVSFVNPTDPLREIVVSISDITEKTRAEEALKESEIRYRLLAENADDIIFTMDTDLRFTYVSPSVTRVRGFTVEEAIRQTPAQALTPDSLKLAMKTFGEAMEAVRSGSGGPIRVQRLELEETCKDGSTIWTETTFSPLKDENNVYTGFLGITRDITARRQAEAALEESEEKYRMVVENAYEGIAIIQENVFLFANSRLLDLFGYTEGEFIGKPFTEFVVSDDYGEAESEYRRKIAGDRYAYVSVIRVITKAGEILWTEVNGVQIIWEGTPALLIFVRDVTEKKKIEQALIQSEAKYRELIENALDFIFIVDMDGKFIEINELPLIRTGYSKEDILSFNFGDFVHPDDMGIAVTAYEKVKAGQTCEFEMRSKKKDGTYDWHSFVTRPILDVNGNVEYVHGVARDVTDRKAAEEALVESEEKFRGMFETSRDFMFICDLDGKILDYNVSGKNFFGYSKKEMGRVNLLDIYANPNESEVLVMRLVKEGFIENHEIRLKKKDGTLIDALVTATVRRNRQGNIIGFQGTARDITQMKRMERQLLQAEKLSGLGTMISGVAHEINNPLTAIMGNAELMLINDSIADNDRKSLGVILKESERAARIVSGLLAFAREHIPERRMIQVNDSIMEAFKLREYSLRVSNIKVQLFLSDGLPPTFADPYQLQQVFANIINNARDALLDKGGGTLSIRTMCGVTNLLIEFEDDGPGIQKENIKKIFDPFFTTKDIGKGTGLGLSVAYGIIEEHNGTIEVDSQPGRGAKFTIELPVVDRAEGLSIRDTATAKAVPKGKSILIVDDEKDILELLSSALKRSGYFVQIASTAEDAIALMGKHVFDAIVADIKMPGMGGKELHSYIQKNIPGAAKKMLFITGDILSDDTRAFLKGAGNACIEKPFGIDQFILALNELING
jgi:two-component system cell cycle sensor histidine kinase/response regulator CckA